MCGGPNRTRMKVVALFVAPKNAIYYQLLLVLFHIILGMMICGTCHLITA